MKTLMLVSKNFLTEHVGVRRVIAFVIEELEKDNCEVTLAYIENDKFRRIHFGNDKSISKNIKSSYGTSSTLVISNENYGSLFTRYRTHSSNVSRLKSDQELLPEQFDYTIISCPWIIPESMPKLNNAVGIVYDIVPNLMATGNLTFDGPSPNIYQFAYEHNVGFRYYNKFCSKVIFISKHTQSDYLNHCTTGEERFAPFTFLPYKNTAVSFKEKTNNTFKILCVNFFDLRKNFLTAKTVLHYLSKKIDYEITIVGQPRVPLSYAYDFFTSINSHNVKFKWHVFASDTTLNDLYHASDVLFFPSFYEGLGLPILEAQNRTCPAVTSNSSSCGEINFFPELTTESKNIDGFIQRLLHLRDRKEYYSSADIFEQQRQTLFSNYQEISDIFR